METPDTSKPVPSESNPRQRERKFTPRQQRACEAFARLGKLWREDVDRIARVSNGPDLMRQLRDKGLEWKCERVKKIDRDGNTCEPGLYSIDGNGWETLRAWGFDGR